MAKFVKERGWLILFFLGASVLVYYVHYLIFHDIHHIFIYLIGDLGFLFLDVMLVVIVIEQILVQREKKITLYKLNMLIGAFFSQLGQGLIRQLVPLFSGLEGLKPNLLFQPHWQKKDFDQAARKLIPASFDIKAGPEDLARLRAFLMPQRHFLLSLLANPSLLEHESFTDLLWAIFHLAEELDFRPEEMADLPTSDLHHLNNDIKRVAGLLLEAWIHYAYHLKENYPFLFSLLVRVNPLWPQSTAIVS